MKTTLLLVALLLGACTAQTPEERCDEAVSLYDEAPGVWAGVLTATACAG